jgi:hypothetical protein
MKRYIFITKFQIVLKFVKRLRSYAAETPDKFQHDPKIRNEEVMPSHCTALQNEKLHFFFWVENTTTVGVYFVRYIYILIGESKSPKR